jgi:hypothetical protein
MCRPEDFLVTCDKKGDMITYFRFGVVAVSSPSAVRKLQNGELLTIFRVKGEPNVS